MEGKGGLRIIPECLGLTDQVSLKLTRLSCLYLWESWDYIGMYLMPSRKENAFKNKNKVQFRILLSKKNRNEGLGLHGQYLEETVKEEPFSDNITLRLK